MRSIALLRPTLTSQARGLDGSSASGQRSSATANGFLQRILGEIEIADEADQGRQRPARLVAKDFFDLGRGHVVAIRHRHSGASKATRNLEIPGCPSRVPE